MKSSQVWATGCQAISKTIVAAARAHLDRTMATWTALISIKSLKGAMDWQASLVPPCFETAFAETGKLADASSKLAAEAMAPIAERVAVASGKVQAIGQVTTLSSLTDADTAVRR
jgi:phasin family protein